MGGMVCLRFVPAGFQKGGADGPHAPQLPPVYCGLLRGLRLGGVVVNVNPMYVERELAFQLKDAGAEGILTLREILPRVQAVQSQAPLKRILLTDLSDALREIVPEKFSAVGECPVYGYGEVLETGKNLLRPLSKWIR